MESPTVADAVSSALVPTATWASPSGGPDSPAGSVGEVDLRDELDAVAQEALQARLEGLGLAEAVRDPRFPALCHFHQDLRDALFVEIPRDLQPMIDEIRAPDRQETGAALGKALTALAFPLEADEEDPLAGQRQRALAELLIFESVRLRLLITAWHDEAFETLGGEETDVDDVAWREVQAILANPNVLLPEVRPLHVMFAAASVSLAKDVSERADELRHVSGDVREQLRMRAKLRAALRELRVTESVLLENALSGLLGHERVELPELQATHPIALEGLSRQAMDQRVSRGRRALARSSSSWPRRRRPALYDLLREPQPVS